MIWAALKDPLWSQRPLFAVAVSKNCLQINYVATETAGQIFPKKIFTGRIGLLGRHWQPKLSRKINRCLFGRYLPWALWSPGPGRWCRRNILWKYCKPIRLFILIQSLLSRYNAADMCSVLTGMPMINKTDLVSYPHGLYILDYLYKIKSHFFKFYSEQKQKITRRHHGTIFITWIKR